MDTKLLQALLAKYNARILEAEANLLVYFRNPSGIGEHPNVVAEMSKLVDDIAHARNALAVLDNMVQPPEGAEEDGQEPAEEAN